MKQMHRGGEEEGRGRGGEERKMLNEAVEWFNERKRQKFGKKKSNRKRRVIINNIE